MDAVPSALEYIVRGAAGAGGYHEPASDVRSLARWHRRRHAPRHHHRNGRGPVCPFTFSMPTDMALIRLGGVFTGAMYSGANAAIILINTPRERRAPSPPRWTVILVLQGRAEACYIACQPRSSAAFFRNHRAHAVLRAAVVMALKFRLEAFFWMGLFGLSTLAMFPGNIAKGLLGRSHRAGLRWASTL